MQEFRVTRPEVYKPGCIGSTDKSARQGYYVDAENEEHAQDLVRLQLVSQYPSIIMERLDVQPWK